MKKFIFITLLSIIAVACGFAMVACKPSAVDTSVTVTYDMQLDGVEKHTERYESAPAFDDLYSPEADGYYFEAWYFDTALNDEVTAQTVGRVKNGITLYAKWSEAVTFTFVYDDGNTQTVKIKKGETYVLPSVEVASDEKFVGYVAKEQTYQAGDAITAEEDITFTVVIQRSQYYVEYNLNGGIGKEPESGYVARGTVITLPAAARYSKDGAPLIAWEIDGVEYAPASRYQVASKVTIKALYRGEYTATIDLNGGETSESYESSKKYATGDTVTFPWNVTKSGYGLTGYTDGSVVVEYGETYTMGGMDRHFTAIWDEALIVTYVSNYYGQENEVLKTVSYFNRDIVSADAELNATVYDYHHIAGWYTSPTCSEDTRFVFGSRITTDVTLYAKWEHNWFIFTLSADGRGYYVEGQSKSVVWTGNTYGTNDGHFIYSLETGREIPDEYKGKVDPASTLVIPDTYHGLPVLGFTDDYDDVPWTTSLAPWKDLFFCSPWAGRSGYNWQYDMGVSVGYRDLSPIRTVIIPASFKSIPDYTFTNCWTLTDVIIEDTPTNPSQMERIGRYAFQYCYFLTGFNFPDTLTSIEEKAFMFALQSKYKENPNKPTDMDLNAGLGDGTLLNELEKTMVLDLSRTRITEIGDGAFKFARMITDIKWPANITKIGAYAFGQCYNLEKIEIPSTVTYIGDWAFSNAASTNLDMVYNNNDGFIHEEYDSYNPGNNVFYYWYRPSKITQESIIIPASVTYLGNGAFAYQKFVKNVIFAEGSACTFIGGYAFYHMEALTGISFPEHLKTLGGEWPLTGYDSTAKYKQSVIDNNYYEAYVLGNTFRGCYSLKSVNIPAAVEYLPHHMYDGCTSLTSVTFNNEDTVFMNSRYAFYGCTALESITLPKNVKLLGDSIFENCTSLKKVNYTGTALTDIYMAAFKGCTGLQSFTLFDSVQTLWAEAFRGCTNLTTFTINKTSSLRNVGAYEYSGTKIVDRGYYIFADTGITEMYLPTTVRYVYPWAFASMHNLKTFTIDPDNATSVFITGYFGSSDYTFRDCENLTTFNFNKAFTAIGPFMFMGCTSLVNLNVPEGASLVKGSDGNLYGLRTKTETGAGGESVVVTLGASLRIYAPGNTSESWSYPAAMLEKYGPLLDIQSDAFCGNPYIKNIVMPASLESIGSRVFVQCTSLETITFEANSVLSSIGIQAFYYMNTYYTDADGNVLLDGQPLKSPLKYIKFTGESVSIDPLYLRYLFEYSLNDDFKIYVPNEYLEDYKNAFTAYDNEGNVLYTLADYIVGYDPAVGIAD